MALIYTVYFLMVWLTQCIICFPEYGKQSIEFSMASRKNSTGHWNIDFLLGHGSSGIPRNWNVNFKYENDYQPDKNTVKLRGALTVPPSIPKDYELFPGVGYYKFYPESSATFDEAVAICANDNGHLAIINSEAEANVIKIIYARYPQSHSWALLGFHDRKQQGHFETIFGKPLNSVGYNKWNPKEPDYSGGVVHCGCCDREILFGVVGCVAKRPFFCEFDLSWGD